MKKSLFLLILIIAIALRLFKFGNNPPSLYWDEASLGYNAYLIATSAHDEHGEYLPLSRFIAFGDYKPPGYIYATVPGILLLGLNEVSVRLPSMVAGLLIVFMTYLLVKELSGKEIIAFLSSFLLAVSPWAIHFSRAAFEANLAAFFNLMGVYLFIVSLRRKWTIVFSVIFFIFSFYTFNANRIIAPLLLLGLAVIYFKDIFLYPSTPGESLCNTSPVVFLPRNISKNVVYRLRWILLSILVAIVLILPSISYLKSRESRLRLQEVSIFNNLEPIKLSNQRIELDNNSPIAKIIHNRRILFAEDFLKHYFDNFSGRFLFTHGDVNPRLNPQEMGELYFGDLPFLLVGIYLLIKRREKALPVLILWMLVVPIPAATARETPHALRTVSILPTFQIIIAYGVYQLIVKIKRFFNSFTPGESWLSACHPRGVFVAYKMTKVFSPYIVSFVLCFLFFVNFFYYLHNYYIHYPTNWSGEWQYGYKEMVSWVSREEKNYNQVFVTQSQGRPYIFFAFYQQIPLSDFLKLKIDSRDWFGFWNVSALGKIKFGFDDLRSSQGRILLIADPGKLPAGFQPIKTIRNLSGTDVFVIADNL